MHGAYYILCSPKNEKRRQDVEDVEFPSLSHSKRIISGQSTRFVRTTIAATRSSSLIVVVIVNLRQIDMADNSKGELYRIVFVFQVLAQVRETRNCLGIISIFLVISSVLQLKEEQRNSIAN